MPNRILREGILTSRRVNRLTPEAEVFYRRVMSVVDDFGRFSADPSLLRAACYPLRLDAVREDAICGWLRDVADAILAVLYTVNGEPYLELTDFRQQKRAVKSKCPDPPAGVERGRSTSVADEQHQRSDGVASAHLGGGGGVDEGERREASAEPEDGGSAPGPPARAERGPRMVAPSEEEWVAYARATWPDWLEHDIRSSWAHYEKTRWKGVAVWRACAKTCYHREAGKAEAQHTRALLGAHRPGPPKPTGRVVDEEAPLWVIGVYKALMHPARPLVPEDLEEAWERWRAGEDWNGQEPPGWRERVAEALSAAVEEDARMAVGKGGRR